MSHYLKTVMDCIFGEDNFRNEIIWHYRRWTAGTKNFQRMHDIVLRYTKTDRFTFNIQYEPYGDWIKKDYSYVDSSGKRWRWHTVKGKRYRVYLEDEDRGVKLNDVWKIPYLGSTAKERIGCPTQKPIALLERIIKASSNPGALILDPFCGCATTCVAAEKLDRQWIGMDISVKAYELVKERLEKEVDKPQKDFDKGDTTVNMKTAPPTRTDQGTDHREKKFVYVISHQNFPNEYKVGIAKDWKSRLNSYQTSDPGRQYKIEFKMETPWFRETEKHIHKQFTNRHEWLQGKLDEIIQSIKDYKHIPGEQATLFLD